MKKVSRKGRGRLVTGEVVLQVGLGRGGTEGKAGVKV